MSVSGDWNPNHSIYKIPIKVDGWLQVNIYLFFTSNSLRRKTFIPFHSITVDKKYMKNYEQIVQSLHFVLISVADIVLYVFKNDQKWKFPDK